jgi:hypothetical protein
MEGIPLGGIIRDRTASELEALGYPCRTTSASGRQLAGLLGQALVKAVEQCMNNPSAQNAAEAADLLKALANASSIDWQQVEQCRKLLGEQQGPYSNQVLDSVGPLRER